MDGQPAPIARIVTAHGHSIARQALPGRQPVFSLGRFQDQGKDPVPVRFTKLAEPIDFPLGQDGFPRIFKDIVQGQGSQRRQGPLQVEAGPPPEPGSFQVVLQFLDGQGQFPGIEGPVFLSPQQEDTAFFR